MTRQQGLHGALYMRISREKGENEDTLQNHREQMTEFLQSKGYTFETYSEIVSGGKQEIGERPQLQQLVDNIEKYDAVFCTSLDRLARNGKVSQEIKQIFVDHDIQIITPSQTFDIANNSNDSLLYDVSSMFATMEFQLIGKRNKLNKIQRAKRGEWVSGQSAYGYKRNDDTKKLVIYEPEAKVVRYIFKLHGEGLGSRRIVDTLNEQGYKPLRSGAFNLPTVKRIIKNPVYKGTVELNDRKKIKENGKYVYKTVDTIITPNAHPPIVPVNEWEQANKERVSRADKAKAVREKPSKKTGTTALKDLVFCGCCGRKMTIRKESGLGKYTIKVCEYYINDTGERCGNSGMKMEHLETEVFASLKEYKVRLQEELHQLEQANTSNIETDLKERLEHLTSQLEHNVAQQKKLVDLALADVFTMEELKGKKQQLIEQAQTLKTTKAKLLEQADSIDVGSYIERITHTLELLDVVETLLPEEQNNVLKQFIKQIHFSRVIPDDIKKLSTRRPERRYFPFEAKIEYFA